MQSTYYYSTILIKINERTNEHRKTDGQKERRKEKYAKLVAIQKIVFLRQSLAEDQQRHPVEQWGGGLAYIVNVWLKTSNVLQGNNGVGVWHIS